MILFTKIQIFSYVLCFHCSIYCFCLISVPHVETFEGIVPPEGLKIYEDFVNEEEEILLLSSLDWGNETATGSMKNRRVKHFGYEFMYSNNNIDLNNPLEEKIPEQCDILWERLRNVENNLESVPDQLTVNRYSPGQGLLN